MLSLFLFTQYCLGYIDFLPSFHLNFRIIFHCYFERDYIKVYIAVGSINILTMQILPNHELQMRFYFFVHLVLQGEKKSS